MSVTFETQPLFTGRTVIVRHDYLEDRVETLGVFESYQEAELAFLAAGYDNALDLDGYTAIQGETMFSEVPSVNVSNQNAYRLLSEMGIEFDDLVGSMDANEFITRLAFVASLPDDGADDVTYKAEAGATIVDLGRRAGYFTDIARRLYEVASAARSLGQPVQWG